MRHDVSAPGGNQYPFRADGLVFLNTLATEHQHAVIQGGFGQALHCGLGKPVGGGEKVFLNAVSIEVKQAQIVLRFGKTLIGGFFEPFGSLWPIGCGAVNAGIEQTQIVLGLCTVDLAFGINPGFAVKNVAVALCMTIA